MDSDKIMHPRPSSIVAAMYTLRDLDVDLIVLHGPAGCSFKHARLLEEDGVRVITSSMGEDDFVFGGRDALVRTIKRGVEKFNPRSIGVIGTCASMIIGEDLRSAIKESKIGIPTIEVEIHAGYRDNTTGVIKTLESACNNGFISREELEREKKILDLATEIEKKYGAAYKEYIAPSRGDPKIRVARRILSNIKAGKRGIFVLNAKKETAYMFADILLAVNEASKKLVGRGVVNIANLDPNVGLPRIRRYARNILNELEDKGISIDHISGGLDEYPIAGSVAKDIILKEYLNFDYLMIAGVPHAVEIKEGFETISVTNGPREVEPLKDLLHHHLVAVEMDLHSRCVGKTSIVESELGETIREMVRGDVF